MKKFFSNLLKKVFKKVIDKTVSDVVSNSDATPEVEPITIPGDSAKKDKWKFVIQIIISILTALAASLTTTSCVNHF